MEPRTIQFNFGTSQPKMPFKGSVQEAPENYVIKKIGVNCQKLEMLNCFTEIGTDAKKMDRQAFTPGAEINRHVNLGQLVKVVIQVKQFVPEGINGTLDIEIA